MIYSAKARQEFLVLEQSRRDVVCVQKLYIDLAGGDVLAGIMLSQLVYWFGAKDDGTMRIRVWKDGVPWLAKRWEDWHDECRFTPAQARRCADLLVGLGILVKDLRRFNGSPTVHLSLNWDALLDRYSALVDAQMDLLNSAERGSDLLAGAAVLRSTADPSAAERRSVTETTTETTAETTACSDEHAPRARTHARESAEKEAEEWYGAYPRKVNPRGAKHLYAQLRLKGALLPQEEMLVRLERQKRSPSWQEQRFIPYPRTYLHQTRWEDPEALPPPPPPEEEVRCVQILGDDNRYHPEVWYQERRWNREQWEAAGRTWPEEETR